MQEQTRPYLFLMTEESFDIATKEHTKFRYDIFTATLLDTIEYDLVSYNLYRINTNSINPMHYASAVMNMGGITLKNKLTGVPNELPDIIKQLFNRNLKSAGGSETK